MIKGRFWNTRPALVPSFRAQAGRVLGDGAKESLPKPRPKQRQRWRGLRGHSRGRSPKSPVVSKEIWIIQKNYTRVRSIADVPESEDVHLLTQKMRAYLQWYKQNGTEPFFHRKSHRVVLSLLHVEHKGKAEFVRGINSEVSLPTGSICAERAAIVNARTSFPNVTRKQMKGIAVLEVPLIWDKNTIPDLLNPLPPCGACTEWLTKIGEESPGFYVVTFKDLSLEILQERFLFWSQQESTTAERDLGPWQCLRCKHENVPFSTTCESCRVDRFSASYLHMPTQKTFLRVLQALSESPSLSVADLMNKLKLGSLSATRKILWRLQGRGKHKNINPIVTRDADGRCHITETGRRALERMRKLQGRHPKGKTLLERGS